MLNDYRKYKKEIPLIKKELEELEISGEKEELCKRKKNFEYKCQQVAVVDEWIRNIEDDLTRIVFVAYYQKNHNWIKITQNLGFVNKDYARLHIRDKFLKKAGIK